jgi:hypothetical protein
MNLLVSGGAELELDAPVAHLAEYGWARVCRALSDEGLALLRARADDIMSGRVVHEGLFFQRDSRTGSYDDLEFNKGWQGPSLEYRKIEKLERDPLFRAWMENALFERLARRLVGDAVSLYRAVLMTKAVSGGTELPWHQDGGRFWGVDRDPTLQIWTALDDAPVEAGCVEVVSGTHRAGLVTPYGGSVPEAARIAADAESRAEPLPAKAGDVLLIHNHVWHRSGLNHTTHPRRALSVCLMDAATRCTRKKRTPRSFVRLFERG